MNRYKAIGIFFAWMLAGLVQTLILCQFIDVNVSVLLVHSLWRAVLFFGLNVLLQYVVVFGNFAVLSTLQRWINYSFVVILTVSIWLGVGLLGDFLFFGKEITAIFVALLPVYIPFGLMMTVIIIQMLIIQTNKFSPTDRQAEEPKPENDDANNDNEKQDDGEILEHIAVRSNSNIHLIPASDIYFLSADGDYVFIHTENAKYLKEQTMKHFQHHLPSNFLRIHRAHIVNCDKISRIELLEKQTYYLILKNGQQLKMSTTGYKLLREKLLL
jgi:hypothetical protein